MARCFGLKRRFPEIANRLLIDSTNELLLSRVRANPGAVIELAICRHFLDLRGKSRRHGAVNCQLLGLGLTK